MLYKAIPVFCLLAAAVSQNVQNDSDLDSIIWEIFGTPPTTTATTLLKDPQDISCTTIDGEAGECVPYYLCNNNNNTVLTDGVAVINIRTDGGPCLSYIDTCCLIPDKADTPVTPKPEPKREGCGWRNPKGVDIRTTGYIDGETKFAEFPWMCAIFNVEPDGKKRNLYVGGGSLIHPSVVLTAAHVSVARQLTVRGGEWDTQSKKEPHPFQDREVASIELHQEFNKDNLFYDIALLFLSTPMELAPNVGVACLPPPLERARAASRCFATGWGKDKFGEKGRYQVILKKIEVPVVDRATCQTQLRKTRLGRFFELHTSFMCAGGEAGKDTCEGDGGSPLSCPIENEDGRYMQSGIVAWGIGCGEDGTPGVYVDVSYLRDWVDDKVVGKGPPQIEVPVVDRATCQTQLRKTRLGRFFELHTSFMCAGGEAGKDTCEGDGGSPLSCPIENEDGRYMQSGIVAWGIGCGEDGTPGVYVDVSYLRDWVDDKVVGKGPPQIEVPVVDRATCQTQLRKTRLGRFFELHTSFMCAGGEAGKDTCEGDGGSPLSCPIENEDGRYMQSGIVAWGIGCGEDGTPGVYVDVSYFRDWVDDKVVGKGHTLEKDLVFETQC